MSKQRSKSRSLRECILQADDRAEELRVQYSSGHRLLHRHALPDAGRSNSVGLAVGCVPMSKNKVSTAIAGKFSALEAQTLLFGALPGVCHHAEQLTTTLHERC